MCEEELRRNNWTTAIDPNACIVSSCKPKNIYIHHSYPNKNVQSQEDRWGTENIFDVAGCEPRSYFPNGDQQKICGNPDFEYYWETGDWSSCCTPQHFQTRKITCIRVDKNLNIKTEIDANERDSACGNSAKDMPVSRRSCQCPRWRAKVICDGHATAIETECQTSVGNLPWVTQNDSVCDNLVQQQLNSVHELAKPGNELPQKYISEKLVNDVANTGIDSGWHIFKYDRAFKANGIPIQGNPKVCKPPVEFLRFEWSATDWSACKKCDPISGIVHYKYKHRTLQCIAINEKTNDRTLIYNDDVCKENNSSMPPISAPCSTNPSETEDANGCYRWSVGCDSKTCVGEVICEKFDSIKGVWKIIEDRKACQTSADTPVSNSTVTGDGYISDDNACFLLQNGKLRHNAQYIQDLVSLVYGLFLENSNDFSNFVKLIRDRYNMYEIMNQVTYRSFYSNIKNIFGIKKKRIVGNIFSFSNMNDICSLHFLRVISNRKTMDIVMLMKHYMSQASSSSKFDEVIPRLVIAISKIIDEYETEKNVNPDIQIMDEIQALFQGKQSLQEEARQYISDIGATALEHFSMKKLKIKFRSHPEHHLGRSLNDIRHELATLFSSDFNVDEMCEKHCGPEDNPGVEIRALNCYVTTSSKKRKIVGDWHCNGIQKPQFIRKCMHQKPCMRWKVKEMCANSKIIISDIYLK